MLQATTPALANFAESFGKYGDDYETLAQMLLVANFINNQPLIDVLSAKLAIVIANMTHPQIREFFGITNPFESPEEEERVKKENEEAREIYGLNDDDN